MFYDSTPMLNELHKTATKKGERIPRWSRSQLKDVSNGFTNDFSTWKSTFEDISLLISKELNV